MNNEVSLVASDINHTVCYKPYQL